MTVGESPEPQLSRKQLERMLTQAVEALGFYGNPETYHAISFLCDRPCGVFDEDFGTQREHQHRGYQRAMPGRLARKTLRRFGKIAESLGGKGDDRG